MQVTLRFHGHAIEYVPGGQETLTVDVPAGQTLRQILTTIGIQPQLFAAVVVGGHRRDLEYVPEPGDEVMLLSPAAGG